MTTTAVDNKVKSVVANIRNLPTPPIVFEQIQRVINDPNVSAAQVASILSEDPAMSVKVLKLTNSAFYGLAREVDSVKQAVLIVGLEAIKNLVLSASVLDMFKGQKVDHDFQERFWRHSLATASCTRLLARRVRSRGIVDPDTAFSAGLLHDVGKMVISAFLPTEFARLTQARETDTTLTDHHLEQQTLGYSHAEIGGLVAVHWKLPQRLGNAITFHHSPDPSRVENVLVALVQLGNFLAKQTFYEPSEEHLVGTLEPVVLEYLQLVQDDLDGFIDTLREEYVKAQTFAQMAGIG